MVNLLDLDLKWKESLDAMAQMLVDTLEDYLKQFVVIHVGDNPVYTHLQYKIRSTMQKQKNNIKVDRNHHFLTNVACHIGPLHQSLNFMGEIWIKFKPLFTLMAKQIFKIQIKATTKPWVQRHVQFITLAGWIRIREEVLCSLSLYQRKSLEIATLIYVCAALVMYSALL